MPIAGCSSTVEENRVSQQVTDYARPLSRPVIAACVVQFVVAFSLNFSMAFLTLFIYGELGIASLSEAALWAGIVQLLCSSSLTVMAPVWGWLSDRIGGRRMLIRVLIAHSLVMALLSVSTSVYHVLIVRVIQGVTGGTSVVVMAIIASSTDKKHLAQAIGYQQSVHVAGTLLGPAVGATMATFLGFRMCFVVSSLMIAGAIPFVVLARFREAASSGRPEGVDWKSLKQMARPLLALLCVESTYSFVTPILPLYLIESGFGEASLIQPTGLILAAGSLAYAASVPVTTKLFKRNSVPLLYLFASAVVLLQGYFRDAWSFTILRMTQCFLHSPAPSMIIGEEAQKQKDKGLTMRILNSARFLGGALGPFIASTATYTASLSTAFAVMAFVSVLAAALTARRIRIRH